jgi:hypothetical protein
VVIARIVRMSGNRAYITLHQIKNQLPKLQNWALSNYDMRTVALHRDEDASLFVSVAVGVLCLRSIRGLTLCLSRTLPAKTSPTTHSAVRVPDVAVVATQPVERVVSRGETSRAPQRE